MILNSAISKAYSDLIFKELDTIQIIIKNLDDIIFKTKNFAFLIWSGSLYLIAEHLNINDAKTMAYVFLLSSLIPLLFWAMDYRWRKHILQCSKRQKIISLFMNSETYKKIISGEAMPMDGEQFPFYDPVGWIYTIQAATDDTEIPKDYFGKKYLIDTRDFSFSKVVFYKDAIIFYGTLITLSFILGMITL